MGGGGGTVCACCSITIAQLYQQQMCCVILEQELCVYMANFKETFSILGRTCFGYMVSGALTFERSLLFIQVSLNEQV